MKALLLYGVSLLMFLGLAWTLVGDRLPSTVPTVPDEPVAPEPNPGPAKTFGVKEALWLAATFAGLIVFTIVLYRLSDEPIWSMSVAGSTFAVSARNLLFIGLFGVALVSKLARRDALKSWGGMLFLAGIILAQILAH